MSRALGRAALALLLAPPLATCAAVAAPGTEKLVVAGQGRALVQLVVAADATPAERTAASELGQRGFHQ